MGVYEFHNAGEEVDEIAQRLSRAPQERGIRALPVSMGLPMEMTRFRGSIRFRGSPRLLLAFARCFPS